MMAVLAAREIVLGLIAAGLAYTENFHGLLFALLMALIIAVIDAVALYSTKSIFGFVINNLVGLPPSSRPICSGRIWGVCRSAPQ